MKPHEQLYEKLLSEAQEKDREASMRFFKTGPGEYSEGDLFLGVRVPSTRKICKEFNHLTLPQIRPILRSKYHEMRLAALFILVAQFQKADETKQQKLIQFYLDNLNYINNWDLVDSSADKLLGAYLFDKEVDLLFELAESPCLWERRIAIISTYYFIKHGESKLTYQISKKLLRDPHDLIHKAVGWMLREAGKRVSKDELKKFLTAHKNSMARITLSYVLEKFTPEEKFQFI